MATGQISGGYALNSAKQNTVRPARRIKRKEMKLSLKQRFRNWLNDTDEDNSQYVSLSVDENRLQSDGIRLQVYKASGGYVVETRGYDRKTDRNHNTMHVITEEEDLGNRLSKIVMMEAMR